MGTRPDVEQLKNRRTVKSKLGVCFVLSVAAADKEKKQIRGFALSRGSADTSRNSSLLTPVTLKTEVDSESSRRCTLYHCTSRRF